MDLQLPYLMAIFRVHLQEGKDVGDVNVLADVAAEVGLMSKSEVRLGPPCGDPTADALPM
jgi:hypothetical protein